MNHKADTEETDQEGNTPLVFATELGNLALVRQLLENGASVNVFNKDRLTPLLIATQQGDSEICKELLDHGSHLKEKVKARAFIPLVRRLGSSLIKGANFISVPLSLVITPSFTLAMASIIIIAVFITTPFVRRQ